MDYSDIFNILPFSLNKSEKESLFTDKLTGLCKHHICNCKEYDKMMSAIGFEKAKVASYYDIPFLPVSLFKELELKSIPDGEVFKILTSSGTSGQAVSKIYLDKETAANQQKALVKIVSDFTGGSRFPMLIIDCPSVIKNREMFSARGAGILGFSMFGTDKTYALNDEMELDIEAIEKFFEKHAGKKVLIFGFTFMIWQHFYKRLEEQDIKLDLSNGILIHGGGWKKLLSEKVSQEEFKLRIEKVSGLSRIYEYYGMVEQTGCIYMECECGHLHSAIFSDIITRRAKDFSVCDFGEAGIIQVVSLLPKSYPGHSIITEDEGIILGEDDCKCGRKGKYFKIIGRLKNAEIRGCSDTYAVKF